MTEELKDVYPFVEQWMSAHNAEFISNTQGVLIWSTDYTEYWLWLGAQEQPQLSAFNLELKRFMIYMIPVIAEEKFLSIMEMLNPAP